MRFKFKPWPVILLWIALGVIMLLVGCADAPPTPTPIALAPATATPDLTATSTLTLAPRLTPTPTQTFTASPSPKPSSTPSPTNTPTPTPSPTPTLTPSPTPQPSIQLETARRHQTNGDYGQAITAYLALLDDMPTPDQAREAYYHLAESYLLNREYAAAAAAWEDFLERYPDDGRLPKATLMAARALHAANECPRAVPFYQTYLSQETVLADMVHEWIGDCLVVEARQEEAVIAYRRALGAARERGVQVSLREKIAGIYLAQEDYDAALTEYDAILGVAEIESYRAKIEYLAGQALVAAGQTEAAHARYLRAVDDYPEAEYAYLSLIELVDAGIEVDEFQRGLVDYYAGASYPDAYGAAIRAFDRYLAGESPAKAEAALYHKALAQRAVDQPAAALQTLESLVAGYPESEWLARAWLQKGITLARMGNSDEAVKAYQDLAAFFPADELAPDALWRAAKLREGEQAHGEAAKRYEDVQATFPAFKDADEALWRAGLAHYRAGDQEKAILDWQSILEKYPASSYRAKSLYWLGKLGVKDESQEGVDYWDQLIDAGTNTYYALRVEQVQAGESLTATRLITAPVEPPAWDTAQVETEILSWLRNWTRVPTDTQQLTLPATVTRRLDFRRGRALLAAGLRREALDAFDDVRAAAWGDPLMLAQLSLFFHDQGLYGLAARSAARLAGLWPKGTLLEAPEALQRLAYPLVYAELLSTEAQERNLDPLLLAALIRQESLFEPVAESYAGARGLGQVMPATGEGIAKSLGMEGFVLDDLYRPHVSVKFGAFYLGVQMNRFDDQILIALAAYNGGPGNTLRWLEAASDDLDLFVEVITAAQSRVYLQRVYEQYLIYERLYRPAGSIEE
jgi:soluble lytic murein transglycosylase